jgi:hypothetical protein
MYEYLQPVLKGPGSFPVEAGLVEIVERTLK